MSDGRQDTESPTELESQFILRLPEEPARILHEAISSNTNLEDRFTIEIDNEMRHGVVRVEHHLMTGTMVDLPTIIESLKSIDSKKFVKTADICQMLVCKETGDKTAAHSDLNQETKKKSSNTVDDKKLLWPHGMTPPTRNVKKHRSRKMHNKKHNTNEACKTEKEVRRLLCADNCAVSVKWELVDENILNKGKGTVGIESVASTKQNVAEYNIIRGEVEENISTDSKILNEFSSDMLKRLPEIQNFPLVNSCNQISTSFSLSNQTLSKSTVNSRFEDLEKKLMDLKADCERLELKIKNSKKDQERDKFQELRKYAN